MRSFCETKNSRDLRPFFQDFAGAHPILSSFFFSSRQQSEGDSLSSCAVLPRREPCSGDAADPCGIHQAPGLKQSLTRLGWTLASSVTAEQHHFLFIFLALGGSSPPQQGWPLQLHKDAALGKLSSDFRSYFTIADLDGQGKSKYCTFSKYHPRIRIPDVPVGDVTLLHQQPEPGNRKRFPLTTGTGTPLWSPLVLGSTSVFEGLNCRLPAVSVQIFGPTTPKLAY